MSSTADDLKARFRQMNISSDDAASSVGSPPGSISSRPSRPRPNLGIGVGGQDPFSLGAPSRRPGNMSLGPGLGARPTTKKPTFLPVFNNPQPSHDEYERKLEDIMKLSGRVVAGIFRNVFKKIDQVKDLVQKVILLQLLWQYPKVPIVLG